MCLKYYLDIFEGIFILLKDESKRRTPSAKNLMNAIVDSCSRKSAFEFPKNIRRDTVTSEYCFIIRHFTTNVCYSAVSFKTIIQLFFFFEQI